MRIHPTIAARTRGFTLVEVSVAMLLLTMVLTFVYESFILTLETKDRVEKRAERFQSARVAMQRMEREIQSSYIENNLKTNPTPAPTPTPPPQPPGPGLSAESEPRTVFLGVNTDADGYPRDRLDFTTFAHYVVAAGGDDDRQSDHEEVAYFAETDFKENRTDLLHREDFTLDDDPLGGGDIFPLIEGMRGVNFRYLDPLNKDWTDSWDSREKKSLPAAVEITLWLENPSNDKKPLLFVKVVRVPLYSVSAMRPLQVGQKQTSGGNPMGNVFQDKKQQIRTIFGGGGDTPVVPPENLNPP